MSQRNLLTTDLSSNYLDMVINKVEQSGILVLDLSEIIIVEPIEKIYLKDLLDKNHILREKAYRERLKDLDWAMFRNKNVCIIPYKEAIIPYWAYMLLMTYISPCVSRVVIGDEDKMYEEFINDGIASINVEEYKDKRVVLKGCSADYIDEKAYAKATKKLMPVVRSLMYGEPCSTVPVYKK